MKGNSIHKTSKPFGRVLKNLWVVMLLLFNTSAFSQNYTEELKLFYEKLKSVNSFSLKVKCIDNFNDIDGDYHLTFVDGASFIDVGMMQFAVYQDSNITFDNINNEIYYHVYNEKEKQTLALDRKRGTNQIFQDSIFNEIAKHDVIFLKNEDGVKYYEYTINKMYNFKKIIIGFNNENLLVSLIMYYDKNQQYYYSLKYDYTDFNNVNKNEFEKGKFLQTESNGKLKPVGKFANYSLIVN